MRWLAMGLLSVGLAGATEGSPRAPEGSGAALSWYDVGWKADVGYQFRYHVNMSWTQQYRTPLEEYLMPEHTLTTEIKAVLNFQVTETDDKEGLIAMKVTFEKLEGVRNGVVLSLDALDRMTDLETVMGLIFNKVGLIVPGEPAEIGSTWERTVPMMDPLGESIGKEDRHHAGSTMEFVISRKGYVVKDQPAQGAAQPAGPPKAPEGSRKFDVTWKGNDMWKGVPVAVFRSESETAPAEIERNGAVMTLSGTGESEVKFAWPQGQPVSAAYQERFKLRFPGAVSEMLGVITVELEGHPNLLQGIKPTFPDESLYPVEPARLKALRGELDGADTEERWVNILGRMEAWRAMPRTAPVGISLGSSVVGDQVWWRMMESRIPREFLASAMEKERDGAVSLLRQARLTEYIGEVEASVQEFPSGLEQEAGHRMVALAEMDEGRFQGVKWHLDRHHALDRRLLNWVETEHERGSHLKWLWSVESPFPVNPDQDRVEVASTKYGLVCVRGDEMVLANMFDGAMSYRGRFSAQSTVQGAAAIRVDGEGKVWVFERTPKGWQVTEWHPPALSQIWAWPRPLFPNQDQKNPLHVLEGFLRDQTLNFLGTHAGAARQLMWSAWDVNGRMPRFEGSSLWGVKLQDDKVWQSVEVSVVPDDPWVGGVGTDGTVFLASSLTGKFQWLRKLEVSQVALHPQAMVGVSKDGNLYGLSPGTGETTWTASYESGCRIAGFSDETVVVTSEKGLAGFRVKDGKKLWVHVLTTPFMGSVAVFGKKVVAPEEGGLVLLNGISGDILSKFPCEISGPARLIREGSRLYLVSSSHLTAFELIP